MRRFLAIGLSLVLLTVGLMGCSQDDIGMDFEQGGRGNAVSETAGSGSGTGTGFSTAEPTDPTTTVMSSGSTTAGTTSSAGRRTTTRPRTSAPSAGATAAPNGLRNVSYVETSEYPLWVNGYEAFSFSGALAVIDSRYEEGSRDHIPPNYMKSSDPRDPINYAIELLAYFHWLRDEFEQHIWTAKTVGQIPVSQVSFSYKPYTQAAGTYLADTEFEQRYGQWAIMFRQSLSVELDVYQWYREQGKVRLTEQQRRELILRERRRAELWMDLMYDGSADPDILEQAIAEMDALVEDFARNGYDVEKVTAYNQRYRRENIAIGNIAAPTCRPGSFTPGTITCREERIGEGARLSVERRYIVAYDPVERLELDIHDFPVVDLLYPSFLQIGLEAAAEVPLVIDIQQCRAYAEKVQKSWKPWPTTTSAAPVPSTRRQTTRSGWFTDETGA